MAKVLKARYSSEFKVQAINMALTEGLGVTETARRLSIPMKTLANWVVQARAGDKGSAKRPDVSPYEEENSRLRKENALLRMERDILKKAAAYFAKESL